MLSEEEGMEEELQGEVDAAKDLLTTLSRQLGRKAPKVRS